MGESERMERMNHTFLTVGSRFWQMSLAPEEPRFCEAQTWLKLWISVFDWEIDKNSELNQTEIKLKWKFGVKIEESSRVRVGVCIGIVSWHLFDKTALRLIGKLTKRVNWQRVWTLWKKAFHVWKQTFFFLSSCTQPFQIFSLTNISI